MFDEAMKMLTAMVAVWLLVSVGVELLWWLMEWGGI
jgi:hypothetical protein